jgi:hypothetical protein
MRFEELAYRQGGGQVTIPLHRKLTVIAGVADDARRQWIARALGVLAGTAAGAEVSLRFLDGTGSRVQLHRDASGAATVMDLETGEDLLEALADGGPLDWLSILGLDLASARALTVMTDDDLIAPASASPPPPSAELLEAREVLAGVDAEYQEAAQAHRRGDELAGRLEQITDEIRTADEELAKREHARAVAEMQRLQAELTALTGADPVDRERIDSALAALTAVAQWKDMVEAVGRARIDFGDRRRLDPKSLDRALRLPTEVPVGLAGLHEAYLDAKERRNELTERLAEHAASEMPPPSAPWVISLARLEQKDLWDRADEVLQTRQRAGEIAIGLGGGGSQALVQEIDAAHALVDDAERAVDGAKVQALAMKGRRRLAKALERERIVLERAGFPTYLAFQMRRIDALIDANARETLQVAELEYQLSLKSWHEIASDVDVDEALLSRTEIERYARHLHALERSTDDTDVARRQLIEEVGPAYDAALAALLVACEPFGIDPNHAIGEVAAMVFEARNARLQLALVDAEDAEQIAAAEKDRLLAASEAPDGDLETRLAVLEAIVAEGEAAEVARGAVVTGRTPEEVRADLARARQTVQRLARPGWSGRTIPDGPDPDAEQLHRERDEVRGELESAQRHLPDLGRIGDRRLALQRRVHVLEDAAGATVTLISGQELEMYVLGRFASARRVGPEAEPVPMLVDNALVAVPRAEKWRMLDLMARLAEATQVFYLTDDAEALEWAHTRAQEGTIGLVELTHAITARTA